MVRNWKAADTVEEERFGSLDEFANAVRQSGETKYVLRLYIAGMTPKSRRAIENIKRICDEELSGRYELEIIDIYQQPELAESEQVIAVPTLIKKLPLPLRKVIGDLSDEERVVVGLDLHPRK